MNSSKTKLITANTDHEKEEFWRLGTLLVVATHIEAGSNECLSPVIGTAVINTHTCACYCVANVLLM